jgi:hypothetical protein
MDATDWFYVQRPELAEALKLIKRMAALKRNEKILAEACRIETAIASVGPSSAARLARVWMPLDILLDEFIDDADCDQGDFIFEVSKVLEIIIEEARADL